MKNRILIRHPKNWGLSEKEVIKYSLEWLDFFGFQTETELSLYFVGVKKAKKLNLKYRQKNYIPQVLGFPLNKEADSDGWLRLGDIVICTPKLKYESKFLHKKQSEILSDWIKHGIENLLK